MSVVFASFMNPLLDHDILGQWIGHYKAYCFDRYHVIMHVEPPPANESSALIYKKAHSMLHHAGFTVEEISGDYNNGELQQIGIGELKETLAPGDTLVMADSDEFHVMPSDYCGLARRCDYITGNLIDRWSNVLKPVDPGVSLWIQYSNKGNIYDYLMKKYSLTDPQWFWGRQLTKVLAHKVSYEIDLSGNHFIIDPAHSQNIIENAEIYHYTWRRGIIKRMMAKSYNPEWWTRVFLHYWNIEAGNPDYDEFMDRHRKQQSEKGLELVYT